MKNKIILIIAYVLIIESIGFCIAIDKPEFIVKKYCQADYNGEGLSTDRFKKNIWPLLAWDEEYPGTGWDTCDVIKDFKIIKVDVDDKNAIVKVKYHVLGKWGVKFIKNDHYDKVDFHLIMTDTGWKIKDDFYPRISIDAALRQMEDILQERESMEDQKDIFKKEIEQLKNSIIELKQVQIK